MRDFRRQHLNQVMAVLMHRGLDGSVVVLQVDAVHFLSTRADSTGGRCDARAVDRTVDGK
jgi:hypothetical protein